MLTLTCCQDHILTENIWFVCSETSYSGDERRCAQCTVEKNQTNATNVTMQHLIQALWGHIWKYTVEKIQKGATNVTMHPLLLAIWGHIWKLTLAKSQMQCDYVSSDPIILRLYLKIHMEKSLRTHWKSTIDQSQTKATIFASYVANSFRTHLK